jgi:broad specificity phosphatase PhoE
LSALYLIRHGQAGLRHRYDELSELGRRQARLLGEHLAAHQVRFDKIFTGALDRQRATAEETLAAYAETAGVKAPEVVVDAGWNEFDLGQVYEEMAPHLSEADPQFRTEFEELMRAAPDATSPVHRRWGRCDVLVVEAWVQAKYPSRGETWAAFCARVESARKTLHAAASGENVAVFTSATPIAISTGQALGLDPRGIMKLAGVIYNSGVTTLRLRNDADVVAKTAGTTLRLVQDEVSLFSFNGVPHLADPGMRTFR